MADVAATTMRFTTWARPRVRGVSVAFGVIGVLLLTAGIAVATIGRHEASGLLTEGVLYLVAPVVVPWLARRRARRVHAALVANDAVRRP